MKPSLLHIAKWYPNKFEPLLGIFVRKHILATRNEFNHKVISIYQTEKINVNVLRVDSKFENILEVVFYYKKGVRSKILLLLKLFKEISNSEFDLIHAHVMGLNVTITYLFSKIKSIPYIVTEHWTGYRKGIYDRLNFISKIIRRFTANKASQVQVVSRFLKTDMLASGIKANYKIIGNVVDGKTIELPKNEKFTFVFVGDLEQKNKNVKGIIEAFSQLKNSSNLQLDIIGEGLDKESYINLSKNLNSLDSIKFHGSKSNPKVFEYLAKSHVLVLNSNFETFSIICAEALLSGIPVISTKCGGPESFLNNQTGILIDTGNTTQLHKAMKEIQNTYLSFNPKDLKEKAKVFSSIKIGIELSKSYNSILS